MPLSAFAAALLLALDPPTEEPREAGFQDRVEVRAALPQDEDVAAFATTLDAAEIAGRGEDLAAVLRRVPGARVSEYGGLGRYATVSLRASAAEQVTVLVDGIPQNRALGGPVDLSLVPATQIDRVTVFRGFAPASLGLGGLGGVVDVRTEAPGEEPEGHADVLAGELGTTRVSTGWSLPAGRAASFRIGAEALASEGDFRYLDGGEPFVPDDSAVRTLDNNDVRHGTLLLQGVVRRAGGGELRAAARSQRRDRGVPGVDGLPTEQTRLTEGLDDLTVSWSRRGGGHLDGVDLLANVFDQEIAFEDLDGELGLGVQDQTTRLFGGGVAAWLRASPGPHRVLVRADLRSEAAEVRDRALTIQDRGGADRTLLALTAEDVLGSGRLTWAPSLRLEHLRDDFRPAGEGALPPPADDRSDTQWAGKLGVAWALSPSAAVRGSVGRFHRNPSLLELFGDRGAVVGNPELVPERGLAFEIGAACERRAGARPWSVEVVAFGRDARDLILPYPNSQGTAVYVNLDAARVVGVEAALAARPFQGFTLEASGTLQRTEDTSGGFPDGRPLVYQPEALGWLGATWDWKRVRGRWDLTYVGENATDRLDTPQLRLPARVVHDVAASWDATRGFTLGVDVRNVFDRDTRDVARHPLPGRVVLLHLGWRTRPREGGAR